MNGFALFLIIVGATKAASWLFDLIDIIEGRRTL